MCLRVFCRSPGLFLTLTLTGGAAGAPAEAAFSRCSDLRSSEWCIPAPGKLCKIQTTKSSHNRNQVHTKSKNKAVHLCYEQRCAFRCKLSTHKGLNKNLPHFAKGSHAFPHLRWKSTFDSKCKQCQQLLEANLTKLNSCSSSYGNNIVYTLNQGSSTGAWYPGKHAPKRKKLLVKSSLAHQEREARMKRLTGTSHNVTTVGSFLPMKWLSKEAQLLR